VLIYYVKQEEKQIEPAKEQLAAQSQDQPTDEEGTTN